MPIARLAWWCCSLAGVALSGVALWTGPPPLWVVVLGFAGYAGLTLYGVFRPGLSMFADVRTHTPSGKRQVALTFDDGPHPKTTRQVLEILNQRGARATFFVIGRKVDEYPDVLREMVQGGHGVGLHGYRHDRLYALKPPAYVAKDIERTQQSVQNACGERPVLFRPPIGFISPRTAAGARRARVSFVGWSARAYDGTGPRAPSSILRQVEPKLRDGAIILLHDAAERDDFTPSALEALPALLDAIESRGLSAVTVEELFARDDGSGSPGELGAQVSNA